ncbi:MAG: carbohydrate ABC transporter permease [Pseudomonadota bacterium]
MTAAAPDRPKGLFAKLFEPKRLGIMAPGTSVLVYAGLFFWTIVVLFPLYWLLVTSFKIPLDVNQGPRYIPFVDYEPSLHAWEYLLVEVGGDTFRPYVNSVIIAAVSTILAVLAGSMAAYALARISYKPRFSSILSFVVGIIAVIVLTVAAGVPWWLSLIVGLVIFALLARTVARRFNARLGNGDILFWMISQRILPPVIVAVPVYVMFQRIGLLDTHIAMIITYATVNLPIVVWLMHDFFLSIPRDLDESAEMDGASKFQIFFDIVMPLAKPGIAATSLLVLVLAWNEYLLALFLSSVDAQTMPLLVAAQNATRGPQWWSMSVLILLMIIPVVLIALALQRFIAKGLLVGAVKG